ncbi:dynein beta chain, ciliary isoform X1 [Octopus bimaculoides]|uniref:dynein beta chain, ciliary isoform X1 n=1 Tax=Octopus bimaculoides TaxID=37653 RepID=UPI0022DF25B5|nr:dynein beta chain, ciliary isoform X1 [Octopus bimaculoides]
MAVESWTDLDNHFYPLFETISTIWAESKFYSTSYRMKVLLKETCNLIINLARSYLEPTELFKGEADEDMWKVVDTEKILRSFKEAYLYAEELVPTYFPEDKEPDLWQFSSDEVFEKLDKFFHRILLLKKLLETFTEFNKLEKIVIGGLNGKSLTKQVEDIFTEFKIEYKVFQDKNYDTSDWNDQEFMDDYNAFRKKISEFDHRLATIICRAFDECGELDAYFKIIEMMINLLERPLIKNLFDCKYKSITEFMNKELDTLDIMYKKQMKYYNGKQGIILPKFMPKVSGSLKWAEQMKRRITYFIAKFKSLHHNCVENEEAKVIYERYENMISRLTAFEKQCFEKWASNVDKICEFNLEQPLITRDYTNKLVAVNFDLELTAVLKEVKYMEIRGISNIPDSSNELYARRDDFYRYVTNLDQTVFWYNDIRTSALTVEFPLIVNQLGIIDEQLHQAEKQMNWNSEGIWEYIEETKNTIYKLYISLKMSKENVQTIEVLMSTWNKLPLFERKDEKNGLLLNLDDRIDRLAKRSAEITKNGQLIHELVQKNIENFQADPDSVEWKAYVDYVDQKVAVGFFALIGTSLNFFLNNTDPLETTDPLFEVKLELNIPEMQFSPSLNIQNPDGFWDLVEGLMDDIYSQASGIQRLAKHNNVHNYEPDLEINDEIATMRETVMARVDSVINQAMEYSNTFEKYSYLWKRDRSEFMQQFLLYGEVLIAQATKTVIEQDAPKKPPTLQHFKEQIDTFELVYEEAKGIKKIMIFDNWFRVDIRPFKYGLLNIIKKWSFMFKQYLIDHVINSLNELEEFIEVADEGLGKTVEEGDYDQLVAVMEQLNAVHKRQDDTDMMFEPLKETIELLKTYDQEMPESVHQQIEKLPDKWNNTKKTAITVKQYVAPLQAAEVNNVRKKTAIFDAKQIKYRESFCTLEPFYYKCENAYDILDATHVEIYTMEKEMESLQISAALFEVNIPDFKQLKQCRRDLRLLKHLWDYIEIVCSCISEWKCTLWVDINVDHMDMACKIFAKDIRMMDKELRTWDVYSGVESNVKNVITSLRAIGDLQSPAIRDRHWQQLMTATKVNITMNETTTLADLMSLHLHNFEDEVKNIVDKAGKETTMEKFLKDINETWSVQEFEHVKHSRTGLTLLHTSEELIEILEENQAQLQNMLTSKYIDFFQTEVSNWQKKLSNTDQIIHIWMEVQRTWSHLESIFTESEDIRRQLPEDCERFDRINVDFKQMVSEVEVTKNVIQAIDQPNLYQRLESIQKELVKCEKALAEYLETKRLAFPRFYFVSSSDLLDILSSGNDPLAVCVHLVKLFDSLAKLEFEPNTKWAKTMFSKDGEKIELSKLCDCSGQVEIWLNNVLDHMRNTVRFQMTIAVAEYEEKPRESWIFDFPAQVALCGTQIWWTSDVNMAFVRLEEGYENAMKDYFKKQVNQLNALINMLVGELSKGDRQKIMTICTIDVHARDVVAKLITAKIDSSQAFTWLSQLRHRWGEKEKDCFANICDAQFRYGHEYLGNTPRLVITPLTDRCYITLTQSLHLIMSGAPAGPAGTGKTETTKDLGRALGIMVYVFNCSEQMDYKSVGNIYKGLAQSGAWGCFDEFNRISVEVLSVVAVQVKTIQDAIKDKKKEFNFMGEKIKITHSVGIFITMNPGYAGRTELPENLKALFRPCAMVVPDFELICEIMLVAEGFLDARLLARKFITLYSLCKELLSKQDHYDWGLRAIKSVLVVAGSLKRNDRTRPEDQVLMRALRDFNIPKIVTDDYPVFMGLISDLFPSLDVPRKRNIEFEKNIKQAILDQKLQPEESFVLKVVQLQELFDVRHSVFIIGKPGTGKSKVWNSLLQTNRNQQLKPIAIDLDPKAVTNDELFGVINPATREWKDGLFSVIMRDLATMSGTGPKWIILDGDIDPMWIESLNTVMDDNKILTLASNERIPLTPSMRLLFEISHLKTATPATVSRAGILYINPQDLGWNPYVQSWVDAREIQSEKAILTILFDKYIPPCLDILRIRFKKIIPITEFSHVQMLCYLLECLITPENVPPDSTKEVYEYYFVFACIWAFGSTMFRDQLVDYRNEFSKWWITEFKSIKFPGQGTVFDYYIDSETKKFEHWSKKVNPFEFDPDIPLKSTLVPITETTCIRYFLDILITAKRPVMLVGTAGSGKSVLMQDKLISLPEAYMTINVPFNFYTTSQLLQDILEKPLEKKAGRNYGPIGNKQLIYFVDDMNMPEVDQYFTVQPHTILRQHLDYSHWYDRVKLSLKDIHNTQYVACMNPTAGSFTIDARLQRHFCVFAISFPCEDSLKTIYSSILSQHLSFGEFLPVVQKFSQNIVIGSLVLHSRVASHFLPTAIKFHYIFNLRDLSNIFQGILFSSKNCCNTPAELVRLWVHETQRVYCDKLVNEHDIEHFLKVQKDVITKCFEDCDAAALMANPLIFSHFATGIGEPKYMPVSDWSSLRKILNDALANYNELNAAMNLVLFEDAMIHVCRINRILEMPQGNALLIGVGGSGKQSLSKLASFISNLEVFQITLRKGYSHADLKVDLNQLYIKASLKNLGIVFLMTDAQVADEIFLVLINDLLTSGEILNLFSDDELEIIINAMRPEVKGMGMEDSRENCWRYFIDKVRRNLKVVLCFSPVGATLRVRSRKFPAITNCTSINWFHEWPQEALISVSQRFLQEANLLSEEKCQSVSNFLAYAHKTVNDISVLYLQNERRYNYTTPKSFLEQIKLYVNLLREKSLNLQAQIIRLENGLEKLNETSSQVDDLKAKLAEQEIELAEKNEDANKLIAIVGAETEKVAQEKAIADEEAIKVQIINEEVSQKAKDCSDDLAKAEPALQAAMEALDTLNKKNLTEMKSFGSPPAAVINVASAVMVLLAPDGRIPADRSWKAAKATVMSKVDSFLTNLKEYNKENIHENCRKAIQPYLNDKDFNPEFIHAKSTAAAGLCAWVINIMKFYEVFCEVEPKRIALNVANAELAAAQEKLAFLQAKLVQLELSLAILTAKFQKATDAKLKCQAEADATNNTIVLANRLVGGLASENVRWAESINILKEQEKTLPGDILLVSSFVSYLGCFTKSYRIELLEKTWMTALGNNKDIIPISSEFEPLSLLIDDTIIAKWNNDWLPSDKMSIENATILTTCERWPLVIDPQLQGIKWIKQNFAANLKTVRIGQKGYMDVIEAAVSSGDTVLIENIGESIDPILNPLLGRNTIKKGTAIKIGEKEVPYNQSFQLILHTKLANPHYQPEIQAETTLINFSVTRDGLEEQLLAAVVSKERPDLEQLKSSLTRQQNEFKITLKQLEDFLLARLSAAEGNFLGDYTLVENLETTKSTAAEIETKVAEAKITEKEINDARENYRPAACRASLIYFLLGDLNKIHPMYQFSLKAFSTVFEKAIEQAELAEDVSGRVVNLIDKITYSVYQYTTRGLFERDKLIFTSQLTFQILLLKNDLNAKELDFLLRFPFIPNLISPVNFISHTGWGGIKALIEFEDFHNLDKDIEGSAKRWKKFIESECPEKEKFPQEWKNKTSLQKLCIMRSLRPDRMTYAMRNFIEEKMGVQYVEGKQVDFSISYEESGPSIPIFFILSPGVDPLKDVEALGKKLKFSIANKNFHNISLGQGQEVVAEQAMDFSAKEGHWVILQNVHLVAKWLSQFEKKLEQYSLDSHDNYRVFISAEPAASADTHIIPHGILESAIKIINEPPSGMQANLHKALNNFTQETLEMCARETEFKSILFVLCYFHAVVQERRKFGPQGWNRSYPFNVGDLTISVNVLYNYLEANNKVPWEDLRYLFGEIMYGGHITDDWDRRLCRTYLEVYMHPDMLSSELFLAPGFPIPPNSDYKGYHAYIDEILPPESPYLYGLHPNAEIEFLTSTSEHLFKTVFEMQPQDSGTAGGAGISKEEKVKIILDEMTEKLPDEFIMAELMGKVPVEERTPYVVVAFQECERMNLLLSEIKRTLKELDLGLKGELTITSDMEDLSNALYMDQVPNGWANRAYPSLYTLTAWYADLIQRVKELEGWVSDFQLPAAVWLAGFFNPQSFLTAIMQQMARKNEWPLDKMCIQCDVTKKCRDDMAGPPREGAFIHGLFMEGARWDTQTGMIGESLLKELTPMLPIVFLKAIPVDRQETKNIYQCPVYKTKQRGPTFVWTFNLKTKEKSSKWILGGVCLLLQV